MKPIRYFIMLALVLSSIHLKADALTADQVPEPLQPWINWVLQDKQDRHCPFLYNRFAKKRCAWPAAITIDLLDKRGKFSISWRVYSESWIRLPGDNRHWPLNVYVNNKPALVMQKKGSPEIKLPAGNYTITGEFKWDYIPDNLKIPEDTGLIKLSIRGKNIPLPSVKRGKLWLRDEDIGQRKPVSIQNKLDIQVFRKIIDDVPLRIETRLDLEVSGDQREVKLALPMLKNFIPMRLHPSLLPARMEPDGSLRVQVRPGSWPIFLDARKKNEVSKLALPNNIKGWPDSEIWVFAARPNLRVVEIENLTTIDPQLTNLPEHWKSLPAYEVNQGDTMVFKLVRRGDSHPEPDRLSLQRDLWLDFDGRGYTVNDRIKGSMTQGGRLNALPQMQLGKVDLDGKNQLITRLADTAEEGVEVRRGSINLSADSRMTGSINSISAVGWKQSFHKVNAVVNLPPGWHLFAATGVDNVPQSWISRWTLLDLFLVLITALAITRLWNLYWGLFALLTLALIWHEPEAPRLVWLNILAAIALLKVLTKGRLFRFVKFYRNVFWLGLIILAIPFMVDQVRKGIYPQLEKPWQPIYSIQSEQADALQQVTKSAKLMRESMTMTQEASSTQSIADYSGGKSEDFNRIDPKAKVQTGPGLPQWQWNKVYLSWNGPVDSQQQIRFWYITPGLAMLLNFLRVLMLSVLALLMFGLVHGNIKLKVPALLFWLLLLPLTSMPVQQAFADYPDPALLKDLQGRLLKAPDCLPECAQIASMKLAIDSKKLDINLEVHVQQAVSLPLPAQIEQWLPNRVLVDGEPAQALYRSRDGKLWIALEKGKHTLKMSGVVPLLNKFFIPLPLKPHWLDITRQGWQVEGIFEHGIAANQLQFSRIKNQTKNTVQEALLQPGVLPAFFQVERDLQLGLDWRVNTQVKRYTHDDSAVLLEVPLITGESVITPGVRVKNGKVLINIPSGGLATSWQSVLEKTGEIKLHAAETGQWKEVWRVDIGPIWHVQMTGIPVADYPAMDGRWVPEWQPWPGEAISLLITRPDAVPGQTLTIDNSRLEIKPGKRSMDAVLDISIRSSLGTRHALTLPENSQLQSVAINGKNQPLRLQGNVLTLPVKPGNQTYNIVWRENSQLGSYLPTPHVDLGAVSVNNNLNVGLGQDRWILFTFGPPFGPAVLIWGVLVVLFMLAIGLGRLRITPLKHWQWFLLLIGLSQVPVVAAVFVAGWLIVLGVRGKHTLSGRRYFNAVQLAIGLLTLLSLGILFVAVQQGLLGSPDMQISGNHSSAFNLNWYQDRTSTVLPTATVISVPIFVYRILMLAWSLWLAVSLLNWLKWGWGCFSSDGLWKKTEQKKHPPLQAKGKDSAKE